MADWIGAEPEVLKKTIDEYNSFVERGHDGLFAKDKQHLVPLATAPFYALKFRPLMVETVGPVEINEKMEVINPQGKAIPGFYAGGAIASGWQGNDYYLFGSALGWAVNSGRIAGENAVNFLAQR
jgi:fumarate reductase flavoprotein subunit